MQKLKWNKWIGVDNIPLNKRLLVEMKPHGGEREKYYSMENLKTELVKEDNLRVAIFLKKKGAIVGRVNGAFWFDQPILQWADLEGVL